MYARMYVLYCTVPYSSGHRIPIIVEYLNSIEVYIIFLDVIQIEYYYNQHKDEKI